MDISKIDKNFATKYVTENDVKWFHFDDKSLALYGSFFDYERKEFRRMPHDRSKNVSHMVDSLSSIPAGGRIKFITDSPYISLYAKIPTPSPMTNMCLLGQAGFGLLVNGVYEQGYTLNSENFVKAIRENVECCSFDGTHYIKHNGKKHIAELYFPLYNGLRDLYIGIKEGCTISPDTYKHKGQIVFYGSSITEGGCCSHPGNDYISYLEREFDIDVLNLGFSGNALAENTMTEYLAELNPAMYVLDYDHNAPDAEHLLKTHYKMYEGIRSAHPETPIILITKPDFDSDKSCNAERRKVVYSTYLKAKENGDKNIEFIDGEILFGKDHRTFCTVDTCHPNDLGFYRMFNAIAPYVAKYIK